MTHIHERYDFVVTIFIVNNNRVLLVNHKRYDEWLPIGGHIELHEDPEEALWREIKEECGLEVKLLAAKPDINHEGVKAIYTPTYVDNHRISDNHRHIAFIYFGISQDRDVQLLEEEHREFSWLSLEELSDSKYQLTKSIKFYCQEALKTALSHG